MPRDERSRGRGRERSDRGSRYNSPRRDSRGRSGSGRDSRRGYGRDRPEVQLTKVICSDCGKETEVPFKPTSSKPVYCRECFDKKGSGHSNGRSGSIPSKELGVINEKLDKIMKALEIE